MTDRLDGYVNRFDKSKNWEHIAFRASANVPIYLQQAELAEVQSLFDDKLTGVADALLKDGAVIRDAGILVDPETGHVAVDSGAVYVRGRVRGVPPGEMTIPTVGTINVGVRLIQTTVTELDDPDLYGQISGSASFQQKGAARFVVSTAWGHSADGVTEGDFYPVYTINDGNLHVNEPPPQIDSTRQAIALYDRDSAGGTYVVNGLDVRQLADLPSGDQVYSVSAGRARVQGFAVELQSSSRIIYPASADVRTIDAEPHASTGTDAQRVNTDRKPIKAIRQVRITAQKTVTVVHGSFVGATDPLPDVSVVAIIGVKQASKDFVAVSDYKMTAGQVDWSAPGAEPQVGSTYQVTYHYITSIDVTAADASGFTVAGAVAGSLILVTYDAQLPRLDRLCLNADGVWQWVKGVAADFNPVAPTVGNQLLPVATVTQTWDDSRLTSSDGLRVVAMDKLRSFDARLDYLTNLIATQELKADASIRDAAYKRGIFVDPLIDESRRDAGIPQSAAVVDGVLLLPITAVVNRLPNDVTKPTTLAFTKVPVIEQLRKTSSIKVNPYLNSIIAPANVTLNPAVDLWEEVQTTYASPTTAMFTVFDAGYHGSGLFYDAAGSGTTVKMLSRTSTAISTMRSIPVTFTLKGFGPGEILSAVTFDGLSVAFGDGTKADAAGLVTGVFTVPAGVLAGSVPVTFLGKGGSYGEAIYTAQGTFTAEVLQKVTTINRHYYDPMGQTFALTNAEQIVAVEVGFAAKGTSDVTLEMRGVETGLIAGQTFATVRKPVGQIITNGALTSFDLDAPLLIDSNTERAFALLCNDSVTEANVAELGKYDTTYGWVTTQPYNIGNLELSSNNSAWVVVPDKDIQFRLMAARYTETTRTIGLGSVNVKDASDFIVNATVDASDAQTYVTFTLGLPDGTSFTVAPNQPFKVAKYVNGLVTVTATLHGTANRSPILYPGATLAVGTVGSEGTYSSIAFPAGFGSKVVLVYDAIVAPGSSVTATAKGTGDAVAFPAPTSIPGDNDYREYTHVIPSMNEANVRVNLKETGGPAARPRVRNIRAYVVAAA